MKVALLLLTAPLPLHRYYLLLHKVQLATTKISQRVRRVQLAFAEDRPFLLPSRR